MKRQKHNASVRTVGLRGINDLNNELSKSQTIFNIMVSLLIMLVGVGIFIVRMLRN